MIFVGQQDILSIPTRLHEAPCGSLNCPRLPLSGLKAEDFVGWLVLVVVHPTIPAERAALRVDSAA